MTSSRQTIAISLLIPTLWAPAGLASPGDSADSSQAQTLARVRLSVATPESTRVLSGAPLTRKELRRDRFIGTLLGRRDDDVVIRLDSPETELAVPVKAVERIESSRGMGACTVEGASIGIVAGFAGGFALGLVACSGGDCESDGRILVSTLLGGIGAAAGAAIGAITGAQMSCEHWHTVPIKDLPYGEGLPREDGIRLGLALPMPHR